MNKKFLICYILTAITYLFLWIFKGFSLVVPILSKTKGEMIYDYKLYIINFVFFLLSFLLTFMITYNKRNTLKGKWFIFMIYIVLAGYFPMVYVTSCGGITGSCSFYSDGILNVIITR